MRKLWLIAPVMMVALGVSIREPVVQATVRSPDPCAVMPQGQPPCDQDPNQGPPGGIPQQPPAPGDVVGGGETSLTPQEYIDGLIPTQWPGYAPFADQAGLIYFDLLRNVVPQLDAIVTWVKRTYDCAHQYGAAALQAFVSETNSLDMGGVIVVSETQLLSQGFEIATCVFIDSVSGGGPTANSQGGPCLDVYRLAGVTWADGHTDNFAVVIAGTTQDICDSLTAFYTDTLGFELDPYF